MYRSHILAYIANLEEVCTWADVFKNPHQLPNLGLSDIIDKADPLKGAINQEGDPII